MPQLTQFSWAIWGAVIASQFALMTFLVIKGHLSRWPSLFAFLLTQSLESLLLLAIVFRVSDPDLKPALYFWTYWVGALISQGFEVWIIVQLCGQLTGELKPFSRWIRILVPAIAMVSFTFSLLLSIETKTPLYGAVVGAISVLDKSISLGWLVTFLAVALTAEVLGVEWPQNARGVAIGLAIELSGSLACTWLSDYVHSKTVLSNAKGLIFVAALSVWILFFSNAEEGIGPSLDAEAVGAYLQTYLLAIKRIKGITS